MIAQTTAQDARAFADRLRQLTLAPHGAQVLALARGLQAQGVGTVGDLGKRLRANRQAGRDFEAMHGVGHRTASWFTDDLTPAALNATASPENMARTSLLLQAMCAVARAQVRYKADPREASDAIDHAHMLILQAVESEGG